MEKNDILRIISGIQKKHGDSFSLTIKYLTESGKVRKRSGAFEKLIDDEVLVLFNEGKNSTGSYYINRIKHIEKRSQP